MMSVPLSVWETAARKKVTRSRLGIGGGRRSLLTRVHVGTGDEPLGPEHARALPQAAAAQDALGAAGDHLQGAGGSRAGRSWTQHARLTVCLVVVAETTSGGEQ